MWKQLQIWIKFWHWRRKSWTAECGLFPTPPLTRKCHEETCVLKSRSDKVGNRPEACKLIRIQDSDGRWPETGAAALGPGGNRPDGSHSHLPRVKGRREVRERLTVIQNFATKTLEERGRRLYDPKLGTPRTVRSIRKRRGIFRKKAEMLPGETGSQAPSSRGKQALESESHKQRWRPPAAKAGKQGSDLPACPRQPQRDQVHAIMVFRPWPILRHSKRRDYCLGRVSKCSTGRKHLGRDLKDWTGAPRKARRKESVGTNSGERAAQKSPEIWKGPLFRLEPRTDQGHAKGTHRRQHPRQSHLKGLVRANLNKTHTSTTTVLTEARFLKDDTLYGYIYTKL